MGLTQDLETLETSPRITADPQAENYLNQFITFNGELNIPVLTMHTTGDGLVVNEDEQAYARVVHPGGDTSLLRWAVLSLIPTMMDEVFLGFVALYLRDVLHVSQVVIGVALTVSMVGSLVGLLTLGRVFRKSRISSVRLLSWLALLSLVGVISVRNDGVQRGQIPSAGLKEHVIEICYTSSKTRQGDPSRQRRREELPQRSLPPS